MPFLIKAFKKIVAALEGCLVFCSLAKGEPEQVLNTRESYMLVLLPFLESSDVNSNYTSVI